MTAKNRMGEIAKFDMELSLSALSIQELTCFVAVRKILSTGAKAKVKAKAKVDDSTPLHLAVCISQCEQSDPKRIRR